MPGVFSIYLLEFLRLWRVSGPDLDPKMCVCSYPLLIAYTT
jgi:hypothetical protein